MPLSGRDLRPPLLVLQRLPELLAMVVVVVALEAVEVPATLPSL